MNGLAGKSVHSTISEEILNCFLHTMVASGMCHLVVYFPKIYHSGEEGALITFFYIQIRHPSHSSPSVFVQHF